MKLYVVQYEQQVSGITVTHWASTIAAATEFYDSKVGLGESPVIRIITLALGRDEMAAWLNARGVPVDSPPVAEPVI